MLNLKLNLFIRNNLILFMMADPKDQNQISIELNEEVAQGIYSNLAVITHSASEFIIDFVRIMPGIPKAQVKSRIILTPEHAKRLVAALQDNISKYESVHGLIKEVKGSGPVMPLTFGGPTAQA
jgi:site-specific recombinase